MHLTAKFFLCVRLMGHPWDQALLPAYGRFPLTGGVLLREVCAHAKCALTGDVHLREVSISDGGSTITEYLSGKSLREQNSLTSWIYKLLSVGFHRILADFFSCGLLKMTFVSHRKSKPVILQWCEGRVLKEISCFSLAQRNRNI